MAVLRSVLLMTRDVAAASRFFAGTLGLRVVGMSPRGDWAMLAAAQHVTLQLVQVSDAEAPLSVGYSPVVQFNVPDLDVAIPAALMQGATLDGAIRYTPAGKVAMLRAPTGHMLSLCEAESD